MRKLIPFICISALLLLASACGSRGKSDNGLQGGDTIPMNFARYLTLVKYNGYTKAVLRNPWDTLGVLHTYLLVDKDKALPDSLPDGTVIRTPLRKALVYTSVHCSLFAELESAGAVGGVCDRAYISLPFVQDGCRSGQIIDAGNSMNPDIERVIEMHPDAILLSPFENSGGYGRIEKLNIPIVECADYMETSPLGRAEWIRFFGLLVGKEAMADSIFRKVSAEYASLKAQVEDIPHRKTVFSELKSSSAWYVPGGQSTMAQLYADAGAQYVFAETKQSGSVALAFETVFDRAQHADCWLVKYNRPADMTYANLKSEYAPYARFDAYRNKCVYGCNTGRIPFYEETPFHPERLLKDLIAVFYPERIDCAPVYFSRLAE